MLDIPLHRVHGVTKLLPIEELLVREGVEYHYWYHLPAHTGLQAPAHMRRSRANGAQAVAQNSAEQIEAARAASFARAKAFADVAHAAWAHVGSLHCPSTSQYTRHNTTTEANHL